MDLSPDQIMTLVGAVGWPFFAVAAILAVCGRVLDQVFTRDRAYVLNAKGQVTGKRFWWFWGRETMALHPVIVGLLVGTVMPEPTSNHWGRGLVVLYFGGSGIAGLAGWIYLRARGKTIPLPGESEPPAAP